MSHRPFFVSPTLLIMLAATAAGACDRKAGLAESTAFAVGRPAQLTAPSSTNVPAVPVSWTASGSSGIKRYELEQRGPTASGEWTNVFSDLALSTDLRIITNGSYTLHVRA